jgi:hypothetical protein
VYIAPCQSVATAGGWQNTILGIKHSMHACKHSTFMLVACKDVTPDFACACCDDTTSELLLLLLSQDVAYLAYIIPAQIHQHDMLSTLQQTTWGSPHAATLRV